MWAHSHPTKAHGIAENIGWGFIELRTTDRTGYYQNKQLASYMCSY